MGGFVELVAGIADAIKAAGARPFVIPAMGSHGGATAGGQTEVLRLLGVTEESVGAPIRATMATRALGVCRSGATAHVDELAARADGVVVLGRTQSHPENTRGIASGLLKMVTVGLGKQVGAQSAHSHDLWSSVEAVPHVTLARARVLAGVSVVEDGYRRPARIEVVPPTVQAFTDADRRLLEFSRRYAAAIPFSRLDLLVVDEIGKNVSGTGLDLNVIGRWRVTGGPREPDYARIVALSLTRESLGNGLGVGLADFVTDSLARRFDAAATYVNVLTASEPSVRNTVEGCLPLALATEREAAEVALFSALAGDQPRVCRIRNTAALHELWVSPSLLDEVTGRPGVDLVAPPVPAAFDANECFPR